MALAPYFRRTAVAVSQVLAGFDEDAIAERLDSIVLGVSIGADVEHSAEGDALLDLTTRLLARFYPQIHLSGPAPSAATFEQLAIRINPDLTFVDDEPTLTVVLGTGPAIGTGVHVYAGSDNWDALLSTTSPRPIGPSSNPLGAGLAASIAAANLFRGVFPRDDGIVELDDDLVFSTLTMSPRRTDQDSALPPVRLVEATALVGLGAIGNAAAWALSRTDLEGDLHIVDHELIELSNLQRYVLADMGDIGSRKTAVTARYFDRGVIEAHATWQEWAAGNRYVDRALVALDSAADRIAVQAATPRWSANAWTQAGDLGVSVHPWTATGACLACLYLPAGVAPNEDEIIAAALGLPHDRFGLEIRRLLHTGEAPPMALLNEVAGALGADIAELAPYSTRPLRDLYVEGICGFGLMSTSRLDGPPANIQVPLAHQSAMAGVMLAATLVSDSIAVATATQVTRIDVHRRMSELPTQPAAKDPRGICLCQDADYERSWRLKYERTADTQGRSI